jgi:hypothetical protein
VDWMRKERCSWGREANRRQRNQVQRVTCDTSRCVYYGSVGMRAILAGDKSKRLQCGELSDRTDQTTKQAANVFRSSPAPCEALATPTLHDNWLRSC